MPNLYDSAWGVYCGCIYEDLYLGEQPEVPDYLVEFITNEPVPGLNSIVSGLRCSKCGAHWTIHEV
jgi:hypothetical protein